MSTSLVKSVTEYVSQLNSFCPYCNEPFDKGYEMREHITEEHINDIAKELTISLGKESGDGAETSDAKEDAVDDDGEVEHFDEKDEFTGEAGHKVTVNYGSSDEAEGGDYSNVIYYGAKKEFEVPEDVEDEDKEYQNQSEGEGYYKQITKSKKTGKYGIRETNRRVREAKRSQELSNEGVWHTYTMTPAGGQRPVKHKLGLIPLTDVNASGLGYKGKFVAGCIYHNKVEYPPYIENIEQLAHEAIKLSHKKGVKEDAVVSATKEYLKEQKALEGQLVDFSNNPKKYSEYLSGKKLWKLYNKYAKTGDEDDMRAYLEARENAEKEYGKDADEIMRTYDEVVEEQTKRRENAKLDYSMLTGEKERSRQKRGYKPAEAPIGNSPSKFEQPRKWEDFFPPKKEDESKKSLKKFSYDRDVDEVLKELVEKCRYRGTVGDEYKCPYDTAIFVTKNGLAYHLLEKHASEVEDIIEEAEY